MNDRYRQPGRDQNRDRWTEQSQDGGYYDASRSQGQDWGRDGRQGTGGWSQGGQDRGQGQYGQGQSHAQSGQSNWGGNYGQPSFGGGGDHWNTRQGAGQHSSYYGQANMGPSGYDQGRSQGMESGGWSQGGGYGQAYGQSSSGQSSYGQSSQGGGYEDYSRREPWQNASRPQQTGSHHEFEPDYLHWREQQMSNFDRDYHDWRSEKRQKFSSDFDTWRSSRGPAVQAENSVVGDVTDGGPGSQTHARATHEDKPAKH